MKSSTALEMFILILLICLPVAFLLACEEKTDDDDEDSDSGEGTLEFYANGEEFIRDGFVGKTGWDIQFDNFYVNVLGPTAFQVAVDELTLNDSNSPECDEDTYSPLHAGHPHEDIPEGSAHEALTGEYWLDLHEGVDRQLIGTVADAPVGNYNYVNFAMIQKADGDYPNYSIVMIGDATKDTETVQFTIKLNEEMLFSSCHQEVDDENAGVVAKGGTGSVELTFHSDHLFGDYESLDDPDSVNPGATGFQPFADLAESGILDIDQNEMKSQLSTDDYTTFIAALRTLGHSGEGHCGYSEYEEETEE